MKEEQRRQMMVNLLDDLSFEKRARKRKRLASNIEEEVFEAEEPSSLDMDSRPRRKRKKKLEEDETARDPEKVSGPY